MAQICQVRQEPQVSRAELKTLSLQSDKESTTQIRATHVTVQPTSEGDPVQGARVPVGGGGAAEALQNAP